MNKERTYLVRTKDGMDHTIHALYVFNNDHRGEGLVFRAAGDLPDDKTRAIATFAPGAWAFFKEVKAEEAQADPAPAPPEYEAGKWS